MCALFGQLVDRFDQAIKLIIPRCYDLVMARNVDARHAQLLDYLRREGRVTISQHAALFGVSSVTLRRDVEALAERGLLERTHGGAVPAGELARAHAKPRVIAMVVPQAGDYFLPIVAGARAAAVEARARLILAVSDYDRRTEERQVGGFLDSHVDGIVFAPTPDYDSGELTTSQQLWLSDLEVPVVLLERPVNAGPAAGLDAVAAMGGVAAANAARYLLDLGHVAVASLMLQGPNTAMIRSGFHLGLSERGVSPAGELSIADPRRDDLAAELVELVRGGVTAVFAHNDQVAIRAMGWLQHAGYVIPRDVSIIGYDDTTADLADPQITTIAPPKRLLGERAVRLLMRRINEREGSVSATPAEHVWLVPQLIIRRSSATAPPKPRISLSITH